jgi:hypothetical protein
MYLVPLIGIILIIAVVVYLNTSSPSTPFQNHDRRYGTGRDYKSYGKLQKSSAADDVKVLQTFKGAGTTMLEAFFLDKGVYYLVGQFPLDSVVQVDLATADETPIKTIVKSSGFATVSFSVDAGKTYRLHVQTSDATVSWSLLIKPL